MIIGELCLENFTKIPQALQAGVERIELCDNLAVGGTTPSYGVIEEAAKYVAESKTTLAVMIRPRGGNFVYNSHELKIIETDTLKAIEAGAKAGLFAVDQATLDYCAKAGRKGDVLLAADPDAVYERTLSLDVSNMEPLVACPHLPENVHPASEVKNVSINQVIIGSCTNGRISDMRAAAAVFKGRKVKKGLRCIVLPATPAVWMQALKEGLIETMLEAGCVVGPASCGPCLGGHLGILAGGERALTTTNRNFKGRMGSLESEVYLANPAVAAATAIVGEIAQPKDL